MVEGITTVPFTPGLKGSTIVEGGTTSIKDGSTDVVSGSTRVDGGSTIVIGGTTKIVLSFTTTKLVGPDATDTKTGNGTGMVPVPASGGKSVLGDIGLWAFGLCGVMSLLLI